jgi:two-component system, cell cycle response regulator
VYAPARVRVSVSGVAEPAERVGGGTPLDEALVDAELQLYVATAELEEVATGLEQSAVATGSTSQAGRARLIRSDVLSRNGVLDQALGIQLEVLTEAELTHDVLICARAHFMLASTYDRLAEIAHSQRSADACIRLLPEGAPSTWPAEHLMVLALFTSYRRHGQIDFTTFEEALRLARQAGRPLLEMAVLNNLSYVALTADDDERAIPMCQEMRRLVDEHLPDTCPSTWLDTIALGLVRAGRLSEASEVIARGIVMGSRGQSEPGSLANCLLTDAEISLARGDSAAAHASTLEARRIAVAEGAREPAAIALRALAALAAASGDFESAYRLVCQYQQEWDAYQSERSEMHAGTLQAIYGVQVERRRRLLVEQLADTDALTGLANRRHFNRHLDERDGRPTALALLDIDHFKGINDDHSHEVGDRVLEKLAATLTAQASAFGPGMFVARIGGEEFVVLLPDARAEVAAARCEAIRAAIQTTAWNEVADGLAVTVSIGVALDSTGRAARPELLSRADARLYDAKRCGRNRVVIER